MPDDPHSLEVESIDATMRVSTYEDPTGPHKPVHEEFGFKSKEAMFEAMLDVCPELQQLAKALEGGAMKFKMKIVERHETLDAGWPKIDVVMANLSHCERPYESTTRLGLRLPEAGMPGFAIGDEFEVEVHPVKK